MSKKKVSLKKDTKVTKKPTKPAKKPASKTTKKQDVNLVRSTQIMLSKGLLLLKLLLIIAAITFLASEAGNIYNKAKWKFYNVTASQGLKLRHLLIEGQKHVKDHEIVAAISDLSEPPILSVNTIGARRKLMQNPWIEDAIIERRLPDTIYVKIIEKTPMAIWQHNGSLSLIDADGEVISENSIEEYSNLMLIIGDDAHIALRNLLAELSSDPDLAKKILYATRFGERRWDLSFEQGITVKMPEEGFAKAWEYLSKLNFGGKLFDQKYKTLDLRDKSRYYIKRYKR